MRLPGELWETEPGCLEDTKSAQSRSTAPPGTLLESRGSHSKDSCQARILEIEEAERAERAALIQRTERLCSSQNDRSNAVLERLGFSVQHDALASPQPPASKRGPESSLCRARIGPHLPPMKVEDNNSGQTELFHDKKLYLGSQMAVFACKVAKLTAKNRSPSPTVSMVSVDSLSSVDTHTPNELRTIPQINSFSPTPPPMAATRRPSRLPVMYGGGKSGRPPAGRPPAGRAPAVHPSKAKDSGGSREVLKPLGNTLESLSLCFRQLSSDDWEKKMDGLKSVRALAQQHQEVLLSKLHEVCLVLTEQVANPRSVVACEAMDTVGELHTHFGRTMDPEVERTGRALLLKMAQTTSPFIHQQANLALDALVEGCSPGRVMSALFNAGLSHRCAVVRGSTAQHLHQLAAIIGEDRILSAGKIFAERFLIAASKMSLDAAPEVRRYGQEMLRGLSRQSEFMDLWNKIIPVKDRHPLDKILRKMRQ
ncbi:uncharacterized protein [Pempheris klunzingeri]|uniref:uncharacterized protein n=1 Tax=Pempheris klunzingeri TaxID=3127111 RepID=UPI0039808496